MHTASTAISAPALPPDVPPPSPADLLRAAALGSSVCRAARALVVGVSAAGGRRVGADEAIDLVESLMRAAAGLVDPAEPVGGAEGVGGDEALPGPRDDLAPFVARRAPDGADGRPVPAVPIGTERRNPAVIVCLEDGRPMRSLRRHLWARYRLTPDAYIRRWGLPPGYKTICDDLLDKRRAEARLVGLGTAPNKAGRSGFAPAHAGAAAGLREPVPAA